MRIKAAIERVPGGLMVVPLLIGALVNTIDQLHLPPVMRALAAMGAKPVKVVDGQPVYEFLMIGGFTTAMVKGAALTLIALFLFCSAAQMDLRIGGRALKKGILLTLTKYAVGVAAGYLFYMAYGHTAGVMGLTTLAIIAGMTNSNGGLFVALTGQYGNRSDVGAIAVLSLNDGPFFTMLALAMMKETFPVVVFLAVLLPIILGMILGNLDRDLRAFLKPGETLTIPFFAFALGTTMNLAEFFNPVVVAGGVLIGVAAVVATGFAGVLVLKLFRERSTIAGMAEGSVAGNAVQTPVAIVLAAEGTAAHETFKSIASTATVQVSIACVTTALLCPVAVILWNRYQLSRGIYGRTEDGLPPAVATEPGVARAQ